ncbi:MAG: tRNA (N(6)-L-threonylcarbamoyladenosine(37)-C(2))-methylthiotransferase MtaB [Deltaproteobacteria bacterium]|nr:tRNA (N(6)-L-threonylcarbamoyladenosine(37)-C(2))-methylthiotransferase MtaB [Deltaproteobacteria bacterium]
MKKLLSNTSVKTVGLANLGCKANQYDGTYMGALMERHGFRLVDFKELADLYLINTCTVTDKADGDSRNLIRRAHRRNPEAPIVVTGCYAQTQSQEVAELPGVALVLGNTFKDSLVDLLQKALRQKEGTAPLMEVEDIFKQKELEAFGLSSYTQNARAYVKIQDGCNQFCSFCIIPFARGRNRSIDIKRVLEELRELASAGFEEAILTGIHLGTYGQDLSPKKNLADLLKAIEEAKPIHRVRISSVDPEEITEEIVELLAASQIFCPHLHIPVQSGDDKILKLMRRRYETAEFLELCINLVERIPRLCLGTDVMVGFPYEDEASFERTYALLKQAPLHYFHVFPYSPKRGTPAAKMLAHVSAADKKNRAAQLRQLSESKRLDYLDSFVGKKVEIVLERSVQGSPSQWLGTSENYLPVFLKDFRGQSRQKVLCEITHRQGERLVAYS